MKKLACLAVILCIFLLAACSGENDSGQQPSGVSFAEARAEFTTTLTRYANNQFAIPTPPDGVFDLVHFESDVGQLAAFVSSDPGDGQQHPLIIWVVGGWSNGISDLPWSYGDWNNNQTASAFRDAGILMMYPSFRGANGNPGYFETLYGEIDDIVAAFEFAASLPYVDPARIYLGGHSTGATRVLLAAAYTDVFRAAFSFGPVDDIGEHNRTQFTFDLNDDMERRMRSPIHWLDDIQTPTFVIEGRGGNDDCLENMMDATDNENVFFYIVEGGDHFDVLAPITILAAQRILADTGAQVNISFTDQDMLDAMAMPPVATMPVMLTHHNEDLGISFSLPFIWSMSNNTPSSFAYMSTHRDDNFWDSSMLFVDGYYILDPFTADEIASGLNLEHGYQMHSDLINGQEALIWSGLADLGDRGIYLHITAAFQTGDQLTIFEFFSPVAFAEASTALFEQIIYSVSFD